VIFSPWSVRNVRTHYRFKWEKVESCEQNISRTICRIREIATRVHAYSIELDVGPLTKFEQKTNKIIPSP
jgi:hypothetical protein